MTKDGKKLELHSNSNIFLPNSILKPNQQSTDSTDSLTHHVNDRQTSIIEAFDLDQLALFFSTRVSILCLDDIVRHGQL